MKFKVTPFLMFEGKSEDAMNFYASIFPGARIVEIERYGEEEPNREGTVKRALFRLGSQDVYVIDSLPVHDFTFTPAFSFFVDLEDESELRQIATRLSDRGQTLMPLDDYAFSRLFTWISDKFGVSWQLNLS